MGEQDIPIDVNAVYELVINVINLEAAVKIPEVKKIAAGNYGGSLGAFKVNLGDLF